MSRVLDRGTGSFQEIDLPQRELFYRLGNCPPDAQAQECIKQLKNHLSYRYCYVKVPVVFHSKERFLIEDLEITSRALGKNLRDCGQAYVFAATIGAGADRLLAKLGITSPARQFITDAAASAYAEGLANQVNALLKEQETGACQPRFSPGFGDFPLAYQPGLLRLADAPKQIGVTLTEALFLTPSKSVTAVIGVKHL